MHYSKKPFYSLLINLCLAASVQAQELENVKKDPFKIVGTIGASSNFYKSNESDYISDERNFSRPRSSFNVYGSLVGKYKEFSLPVSFVLNHYSKSNAAPFVQYGISPTYKWAKLHLGYRNITFSPLALDARSFNGVGVELNPGLLRFAAFYGRLNRALTEDTNRLTSRIPQYRRMAYGVKIGIGDYSSFFDVMYFHAKDDSNSSRSVYSLLPQENAVVATSFRITMFKRLALTGDLALSGLTQDVSGIKINLDSTARIFKNVITKLLNVNASTSASYAGQTSLSFNTIRYNTNMSYRRVQPDFVSFGTPYTINDIEIITWSNNFSLIKGRMNISSNISNQHNNLNKKLGTELQTQVGILNVSTILGEHTALNFNYTGFNLKQKPGVMALNDSFKLEQRTSQLSITPTYNFTKGKNIHSLYGNVNYSVLKDRNPSSVNSQNAENVSTSLNYTLAFINKPYNISFAGIFSKYAQSSNSFTSYGPTISSSGQVLKNRNLNIQGSIGLLFNEYNSGNDQKNMTYSISSAYQVKRHSFNLFANYVNTQPNAISEAINKAINQNIPSAVITRNFASGVSYNYTF